MKLAARIAEARGLSRDIQMDLSRVEELCGARNPEESANYLNHISCVTLHELREHVNELLDHYMREVEKRLKAEKKAVR